jgi:hypothetical protein
MRGEFSQRLTVPRSSAAAFGAIAQLGERLLCKQEVVGSIPSGSTRRPIEVGASLDCPRKTSFVPACGFGRAGTCCLTS